MGKDIKVGFVGLDSSHSIEFIRRMQAPDCPAEFQVKGMRATACMRFETPFQNKEGLDARQKTLEGWGVRVTTSLEEAVTGCDVLLITINDPSRHLEFFRQCAGLGKPVFLDKPLADTLAAGREIAALVAAHKMPFLSCSSLRFAASLLDACRDVPAPEQASTFGPLGKAPAGSSIVWYGVHAFEMLERAMGRGAAAVTVVRDRRGVVCVVEYPDGRRGLVELTEGNSSYGGTLRGGGKAAAFIVNSSAIYTAQLVALEEFYRTGNAPLTVEDALEVMALLDAAQQSLTSGKTAPVQPNQP